MNPYPSIRAYRAWTESMIKENKSMWVDYYKVTIANRFKNRLDNKYGLWVNYRKNYHYEFGYANSIS